MTAEYLLQYRSICKELSEKNAEIKNKTLSETVSGSDSEFPYVQRTISVSGMEEGEQNKKLLQRVKYLKFKKSEIEKFIDGIDNSFTRRIFEYRYIKGERKPSWRRVAAMMGGDNTADGVRMAQMRYLERTKEKGD